MTTPAGLPAWTRVAEIDHYGGHPEKRDFQAQGVVNPQTDVSAAAFMRMTADMAALTRVAPFCVLTVQCEDSALTAPSVVRAQQMGIVSVAGYAGASPPDVALPTLARVGDGAFTVTWPETATDDYDVSATIDLEHITATAQGVTLPRIEAEWTAPRVLTVAVFSVDVAAANALLTIEVG